MTLMRVPCDQHIPSPNPRSTHCVRCGLARETHANSEAREQPRERNLQSERDITQHAAQGVTDPAALIEHAEARAQALSAPYVASPTLVAANRDRKRDVREELADGRNHLVWHLQEHPDDHDALVCLRFIALAYGRVCE